MGDVTDFSNLTELDLRALDYRNMKPAEFMLAERQAQLIRRKTTYKKKSQGKKNVVRIGNKLYEISDADMSSLRRATSVEYMDTLKSRITSKYIPISDIEDEEIIEAL